MAGVVSGGRSVSKVNQARKTCLASGKTVIRNPCPLVDGSNQMLVGPCRPEEMNSPRSLPSPSNLRIWAASNEATYRLPSLSQSRPMLLVTPTLVNSSTKLCARQDNIFCIEITVAAVVDMH